MQGIIVKIISNDYTVIANDKSYLCKCRGKIKYLKTTPLVGDVVIFDEHTNYIDSILPRKNELVRPRVANVDIALVITSVKHPDFDTNLLDKLLTIISFNRITPIICLTKLDLLNDCELKSISDYIKYYQSIGYIVIDNRDLDKLRHLIAGRVVVFTGQSGAGKSTLLNRLDSSLNIQTDDISYALNRGKHTTRHTEIYSVDSSLIVDTPGFSQIDFRNMTKMDIRDNMKEMFANLELCKYRDCMHIKEDGCYVIKMVKEGKILSSRYHNYLKFISSKENEK